MGWCNKLEVFFILALFIDFSQKCKKKIETIFLSFQHIYLTPCKNRMPLPPVLLGIPGANCSTFEQPRISTKKFWHIITKLLLSKLSGRNNSSSGTMLFCLGTNRNNTRFLFIKSQNSQC